MRAFTIGNFVDDNGRIVINAWARAFKVSDQSLVETQYSDTSGNISFVALGDTDDIFIIVMWGNPKNTRYFWSEAPATMDEIQEGSTYGKVRNTQISSGLIYLTENQNMTGQGFVVESASSGARCALTSTGLKTYDATTQRVNISNDGSGWFGSSTAFAWTAGGVITCTGITVQSASSGERAILDSNGLTIIGGKLTLKDSDGTNSAVLYVDTGGIFIADAWNWMQTNHIKPKTDAACDLGLDAKQWRTFFCNSVRLSVALYPATANSVWLGTSTLYFSNLFTELVTLHETTTPGAVANFGKLYTKSDNLLYFQDGAGTEKTVAFV